MSGSPATSGRRRQKSAAATLSNRNEPIEVIFERLRQSPAMDANEEEDERVASLPPYLTGIGWTELLERIGERSNMPADDSPAPAAAPPDVARAAAPVHDTLVASPRPPQAVVETHPPASAKSEDNLGVGQRADDDGNVGHRLYMSRKPAFKGIDKATKDLKINVRPALQPWHSLPASPC
jgi:hypothetical protein